MYETTPYCHLLHLPAAPPSPISELLPIDQRVLCDYHGSCLVMLVTKRDRWESTSQRASNV
jgi:hypothetical protein